MIRKQFFRAIRSGSLLLVAAGLASAGTYSPELDRLSPAQLIKIIVKRSGNTVPNYSSQGIQKLRILTSGDDLCQGTVSAAIRLSSQSTVNHVSVNQLVQGTGSAKPVYDFMPQTVQPKSPLADYPNFGQGVGIGVALIDSGVTPNLDLAGSISYSQSFVTGEDANDYYGHGTHLAGLIVGRGVNSLFGYGKIIHGLAPGARIINLKVLDRTGQSDDATVISAIDWAITNRAAHNIRVINLALGRPVYESWKTDPLGLAVQRAWLAGLTVVVASGNAGRDNSAGTKGYATVASPANHPLVITVGAMNTSVRNSGPMT